MSVQKYNKNFIPAQSKYTNKKQKAKKISICRKKTIIFVRFYVK
jgi:hypothetical protein